jgi:hypothetical protein
MELSKRGTDGDLDWYRLSSGDITITQGVRIILRWIKAADKVRWIDPQSQDQALSLLEKAKVS